jgi:tetratricopeptide (TPR) repeat protein
MLSLLYENAGRYDDAAAAAKQAYEIAREANDRLFMATSQSQLAQAHFSAGDLVAARESYAEAKALFEEIGDVSRAAQVTVRLARMDFKSSDLASAKKRVDEVLVLALREALHEPAIEAMELSGDIANQRGDTDRAIETYRQTIRHIDETGFVVTRNRVTIKLANLLLDENELAAAEPLIGNLIDTVESASALRVRARYSHLQGDSTRAVELMETLLETFPDEWTGSDGGLLERYREGGQGQTDSQQIGFDDLDAKRLTQ